MLYIANEVLNLFGFEQAAVLALATMAAFLIWAAMRPRTQLSLLALLLAGFPVLAGIFLAISCRNTCIATIELLQYTEALSTPQAELMLAGTDRAVVRIFATGLVSSLVLMVWRRRLTRRLARSSE